ncbi:glyoxylase I family protein [Saccharomonospora amisosensis]|uniref:Glyoxylase I family protein n=1 Tax=Saccharomonospora amisosensis TaxID=1128677 RepID=A0A7X5UVI5_9PSEU|nr:VOC family protein [Saccharomonospora amisosensis]NIJ14958.1 glyoxylase I family protein [Saccharomonospora amisosensis]
MSKLAGMHHLALTVTDIDRSVPWYVRVLGLEEVTRREDPELGLRKVVLSPPGEGFAVMLVQHTHAARPPFDERHTGLDHVAFRVASRADLAAWERRLADYGVTFTPAEPSRTSPGCALVAFRDPDGIQLEVWADPE